MRKPIFFVLMLFAGIYTGNAQENTRGKEAEYKRWLQRDAAYLITRAESDEYQKLTTDEQREQWVEQFWLKRDPTPGTEENEFQTAYYERIAYANEHFTSGIPGWKTDRGRYYIAWGKPDRVESGNTPAYEMSVPYEKWYYDNPPLTKTGLVETFNYTGGPTVIVFVDPTSTKEFREFTKKDRRDFPLL